MPDDDALDRAIQALLDGRPLPDNEASASTADEPLAVLDAIARASRLALFGRDARLDRETGTRWGHLEVRGEIGRGASGTVYRAWDSRLAREVALKLVATDLDSQHALEEGRLLARLNHPHIVKVFGADAHDGTAGIWMELLDGETLDEQLARDGVLGIEETLLIGLDLARALSAVHATGLLHRDIKARNVIRERGGRIVVTDIGAGRAIEDPHGGAEVGTPLYMAPEVLAGGAATVRSDLYSLAVLLYRLLTGAYPVTASTVAGLRQAHAAQERVPISHARPSLPKALADAIERGCALDPDARYASAAEFEAALVDALHSVLARVHVPAPLARRWLRWRRLVTAMTAVVAVVGLAIWAGWDSTSERSVRRRLGLPVPPLSPLFFTTIGGGGTIRRGQLTLTSSNVDAPSPPGLLPWEAVATLTFGTPDGRPLEWIDGTTDGHFNYAIRADSRLVVDPSAPPLPPPALYRFDRDWTHPRVAFPLTSEGNYSGVTWSPASHAFWLAKQTAGGSVIEQWSPNGQLLGTPIEMRGVTLKAMAADPRDGTLWMMRYQTAQTSIPLENFDTIGQHLGTFLLAWPLPYVEPASAEFGTP